MSSKKLVIASLEFARKTTDLLLKDFPEDKRTYQPLPTINHLVWNIGHLAHTEDWLSCKLDGKPSSVPESYAKLFGYGSTIGEPNDYPPFDEIIKHYHTARIRFITAINEASDEALKSPLPEFDTDVMGAIFMMVWHEGWHGGQLSLIRKALGLPSIYGG